MMLCSVLNRDVAFDIEKVPASSDAATVSIPVQLEDEESAIGSLELEREPDHGWRFTANTVDAVPGYWAQVRDRIPVHGFRVDYEESLDIGQRIRGRVGRHLWREVFFLEIWQWIGIGVLLAAVLVVSRALRGLVSAALRKRLGERGAKALDLLKRGISWWLGGAVWVAAVPYLDLSETVAATITIMAKLVATVGAVTFGIGLVELAIQLATERAKQLVRRADSIFIPIIRNFARILVVGIGLFGLLASLDVNVIGLAAGLGIGGLVLAFAAKDSVENVFGSLTILFDVPFGVGDWVKIDQVSGVVEEINLRSTRIRTFQDSVVTVPNSNLTKAAVENFGSRRQRRIDLTLTAPLRNEIASVVGLAERLREFLRSHAAIRADNAYAYVTGVTDAGITVLVQGYIMTSDYEHELKVRQELAEAVLRLAGEAGVQLGPPEPVPVGGA